MGGGGERVGAGRPKGAKSGARAKPRGWRDGDNHGGKSDPLEEHAKLYNYSERHRQENPGAERMSGYELLMYQINDDALPPAERRSAAGMVLPYERPALHRIDARMNVTNNRPAMELTDDELLAIIAKAPRQLEGEFAVLGPSGGTAAEEAQGTVLLERIHGLDDGIPAGEAPQDPDREAGGPDAG